MTHLSFRGFSTLRSLSWCILACGGTSLYYLVMVACGIPWGHGIRKQPVNVATGGLHSCLSCSCHSVFMTTTKFQQKTMSPCQVSIYYRLRPPHSISIMGKGKCVSPIDRLTLFDICFISCSDCHSLRAFSTARYSQHSAVIFYAYGFAG